MVPKNVFTAVICATLLAWSGLSVADEYRPGEFLGLDLSKAVLSPKPLGPSTQFAPFPIEARTDRGAADRARGRGAHDASKSSRSHLAEEKWQRLATRLARRHGNPLDAQAFDTRIQVWPCKSGGICNW